MLERPPNESPRRSWFWVAALTVFLYAGIFVARDIQRLVELHFGRIAFLVLALGVFAAASAAAFVSTRRRPASVAWILAVLALYTAGAWRLRHSPEEALHFVEYGALGFLIFRAYSHRLRDPMIYAAAGMLGGILGSVDEVIQYFVPDRFFDFRDIVINVLAVWLMQAAIALGLRPAFIARPVRDATVKDVARLALAWCVLLLLCFSNTIERQEWILKNVPHPAYMDRLNDRMVEYGLRHVSPDGTIFKSRLTIREMRAQDATNAAAHAALLDRYAGTNGYRQFHFDVSPAGFPVAYEARVRLFRRDKYSAEAVKLRHTPEKARYAATIAFQENRLAEQLYSNMLAHSTYALRDDWRPIIAALADKESPYASPVGEHLFTRFSERQAQVTLLGLILMALLLSVRRS